MALCKIGMLLFKLVPSIALRLVGRTQPTDPIIPEARQHKEQEQ